jgi:tetratricopeptide (TPR) repeat protein
MASYSFELPKSQRELDNLVNKVHGYSEQKEFSRALALCQHMINHDSTRMTGYRERAEIWQAMTEHDLALHDLQQLMALGSVEPVDYYNLGIAELRNTEANKAVAAFTKGIELGEIHNSSYYSQSCRFHRAAAFLRLGMPKEALEDCNEIEDGYRCFLPSEGLKTKEDLVAQALQQI